MAILATAVDVPFWDEWEWAELIYRAHAGLLTLGDVWAQHNEHRLFFPQLIVLALDWLGGWSQKREQLISLFVLVCSQVALLGIVRRTVHGAAGSVAAIFGCVFLFGLWQWENLSWGFQMAWFMCNACAIGVVDLLTRPHRRAGAIALAIVLGFIASYSSSQGLLVWASGFVALILVPRAVLRESVAWIVASVTALYIFSIDSVPRSAGHMSLLQHPLDALGFVLAYLGAPVENAQGPGKSAVFGAIVLGAVVVSFVADLRRTNRMMHLVRRAPWYALATYPLLCALATAYGRGQYGLEQALVSRYTSISGLMWVSAIAIGCTYVGRLPESTWRVRAFGACLAALVVFLARAEYVGWSDWSVFDAKITGGRAGLIRSDGGVLPALYPDPDREKRLIEDLKKVHDGVFTAS